MWFQYMFIAIFLLFSYDIYWGDGEKITTSSVFHQIFTLEHLYITPGNFQVAARYCRFTLLDSICLNNYVIYKLHRTLLPRDVMYSIFTDRL